MERHPYTRIDYVLIAALFIVTLIAALLVAWFVVGRVPHLEDEIAYIFQARTYARGDLWAPVPQKPSPFFTPFVLNLDGGKRAGKYSLGWPIILAIGEKFGTDWVVNPVLGALTVVLIYMLGRELFDRQIGLIAAIYGAASPFFLLQSANFMSHAAAALWAALLALSFLRADIAREDGRSPRLWAVVGGVCIGMLALTRALTAVGVVLPYALILLFRLVRHPRNIRSLISDYWPMVLVAALLLALQPIYLYALTGDPTTNLYLKVWKYDTVGFGPQFGRGGHTVEEGLRTAGRGITLLSSDLFGLEKLSWVPLVPGLIFGFLEARQTRKFWPFLLLAPTVMLIVVHIAYWVGAEIFGPRYYYEGHPGMAILAALGIRSTSRWLAELVGRAAGWLKGIPDRLGSTGGLTYPYGLVSYGVMVALILVSAIFYTPKRFEEWHSVYGITRAPVDRLEQLVQTDHVLVLVRGGHWQDYAAFFYYNSPWLDGPIVAAHDNSPGHQRDAMNLFPDREVWFYNAVTGQFTRIATPYQAAN